MKYKKYFIIWVLIVSISLVSIGYLVYNIDPFFHYHKPKLDKYYYVLDNERSQNDGIVKNFDYDAIITGSSMVENFKVSEMNDIYNTNAIKVAFSGGTFKETNDIIKTALKNNNNLKIVIRCLDMNFFFSDKDSMRTDLGDYPTYLYDESKIDDVYYLFNKDVLLGRIYPIIKQSVKHIIEPGIDDFDSYYRWQDRYEFGRNNVVKQLVINSKIEQTTELSQNEKELIKDNIKQNVTETAKQNPNVDFYYFISPYSAVWWNDIEESGLLKKQIEAEELIISLILECDNIHLFSFNTKEYITTNLNNYMDQLHYGDWINTSILKWMESGDSLLTKDNYKQYLLDEYNLYSNYDYESLNYQEDYDDIKWVDIYYNSNY